MRLSTQIAVTVTVAALVVVVFAVRRPALKAVPDDWTGLFVAVTKGFEGPTSYVGSDGEWSYFRSGGALRTWRKVRTARMSLPETFPIDGGAPYELRLEHFRESPDGVFGSP